MEKIESVIMGALCSVYCIAGCSCSACTCYPGIDGANLQAANFAIPYSGSMTVQYVLHP